MKALRCTYDELLALPAIIYQGAIEDINAASAVAKSDRRWKDRQ